MSTTRRRTLLRRGRHDSGASAVEYALILAGVGLVSIGAIYALNRSAEAAYVNASNNMQGPSVTATPSSSVLPSVSVTPTTTSATPTTSSATPTSATPTTTTAAPSPSPTTTIAQINRDARKNRTTTLIDLDLDDEDDLRNETASMTPSNAGDVEWDGDRLRIDVDRDVPVGTVITVTYSYRIDGVTYTGTVRVTVTRN